jgi:hypothetical protein
MQSNKKFNINSYSFKFKKTKIKNFVKILKNHKIVFDEKTNCQTM